MSMKKFNVGQTQGLPVTREQAVEVVKELIEKSGVESEGTARKPLIQSLNGHPTWIIWPSGPNDWAEGYVTEVPGVKALVLNTNRLELVQAEEGE